MQHHVNCPVCSTVLEYTVRPPRFCSQCGKPLPESLPDAGVATIAYIQQPATRPDTTPMPAAQPHLAPTSIGGYRLLRPLGSGGMGTVYEAEQEGTSRRVAVKIIRPEFADSAEAVERFRREGRLASTITHPRCVFVLAADEDQGQPYIVMELMPGRNLADLIEAEGPLPVEKAVRLTLDIIEGLQEAHRCGVIHRDVKPSNCFLDASGRVKVGDFGLAKSLLKEQHLTHTGTFLGTLLFASPEQIRLAPVDHRADIYSVGATLYYLLTGQAPFQTEDAAATLARTMSDPLTPLRSHNPALPQTLDEIVAKALQRNPDQRFQSLEELRLALLPFIPGDHSISEVGSRVGALLLDALILAPLIVLVLAGVDLVLGGPSDLMGGLLGQLATLVLGLLYFGGLESRYGCTPGKWVFRLRVHDANSFDRPTWTQALLRTLVFYLFKDFGPLVVIVLVQPLKDFLTLDAARSDVGLLISSALAVWVLPLVVSVLGLALTAVTMRRRNGYRGVHELASGTRTIRLPLAREQRRLPTVEYIVTAPTGVPTPGKMGAFLIRKALSWQGERGLFLAEDSGLGRQVWIWLHGEGSNFATPIRREVGRTTRPRWVASGTQDGHTWDAFVAAPGCPLTALIRPGRRLLWADFLPILEQLTEELAEAVQDGTLPRVLSLEQIWIEPSGRVQLLDAPATPTAPATETDPASRALQLLREACRLALEGRTNHASAGEHLAAPLPGPASALMDRLFRTDDGEPTPYRHPAELRCELEAVRNLPTEVSKQRRGLHLAVQAFLLAVGLAVLFLSVPVIVQGQFWQRFMAGALAEVVLRQHEQIKPEDLHDLVDKVPTKDLQKFYHEAGRGVPEKVHDRFLDDLLTTRSTLKRQLAAGKSESELILASCSGWVRNLVMRLRKDLIENLDRGLFGNPESPSRLVALAEHSQAASRSLNETDLLLRGEMMTDPWVLIALIGFWPVVWGLWALLTRGGWVRWLIGIRLVQADGRPASRLRCLWRCVVIWLPIVGLLLLSASVDLYRIWTYRNHPEDGWLLAWIAWGSWWLAVVLLPVYAWFARQNPARSLHDRLAGTYQVPA